MSKGCVIFDFDGVIADTERLHLSAYNETLAAHAAAIGGPLLISAEDYFSTYIVFGDHEALFHMLSDHGRPNDGALIRRLAAAKHDLFQTTLHRFADPLPGVREVLAWLEAHNIPRAICSGARRTEIETLLDAFQLRRHFDVLVAVEDVVLGKPEPEGYVRAFNRLKVEREAELDKELSLVIEDSAGGCAAARAAGLRVLGVANSLPLEAMKEHATYAVATLADVTGKDLAAWLGVTE